MVLISLAYSTIIS